MHPCPECGHPIEAATCTNCGHALANGQANTGIPPEAIDWVIQKTPPEMIEEMRRTFNEEAFLAELRETERNGGAELKDFICQLEQEADCP